MSVPTISVSSPEQKTTTTATTDPEAKPEVPSQPSYLDNKMQSFVLLPHPEEKALSNFKLERSHLRTSNQITVRHVLHYLRSQFLKSDKTTTREEGSEAEMHEDGETDVKEKEEEEEEEEPDAISPLDIILPIPLADSDGGDAMQLEESSSTNEMAKEEKQRKGLFQLSTLNKNNKADGPSQQHAHEFVALDANTSLEQIVNDIGSSEGSCGGHLTLYYSLA